MTDNKTTTYSSTLMKWGSNLYSNSNQNTNWDSLAKVTGFAMMGDIYSGAMNGLTSYFQTKSDYYLQSTELYNQSVPLYQKIGAQVREQMNNQANQYMNAGVDVSQGTANYVIAHTQEQGTMKLNEIQNNLNATITNMRKLSSSQATAGLVSNIANGFNTSIDRGFNFLNMASQAGAFLV